MIPSLFRYKEALRIVTCSQIDDRGHAQQKTVARQVSALFVIVSIGEHGLPSMKLFPSVGRHVRARKNEPAGPDSNLPTLWTVHVMLMRDISRQGGNASDAEG